MNYSWFHTEIPFMSLGKVPSYQENTYWYKRGGGKALWLGGAKRKLGGEEKWFDLAGSRSDGVMEEERSARHSDIIIHPFITSSSRQVSLLTWRLASTPTASTRLNTSSYANKTDENLQKLKIFCLCFSFFFFFFLLFLFSSCFCFTKCSVMWTASEKVTWTQKFLAKTPQQNPSGRIMRSLFWGRVRVFNWLLSSASWWSMFLVKMP